MKISQFSGKPALLLFLSKQIRCVWVWNFLGSMRMFKARLEIPVEWTTVRLVTLLHSTWIQDYSMWKPPVLELAVLKTFNNYTRWHLGYSVNVFQSHSRMALHMQPRNTSFPGLKKKFTHALEAQPRRRKKFGHF